MTMGYINDGVGVNAKDNSIRKIIKGMVESLVLTTVPEPTVFSTPFGDFPDDANEGYLIIYNTISTLGSLNGLPESPLTEAEISGKRIVIQQGSRPYTDYNDRKDLLKLIIVAESIEIRSPFYLPQTTVEIYARHVTFSDGGSVITTPVSNTQIPSAKPDGKPGDGSPGLSGGNLILFAETVDWPKNRTSPPFILRGARGQAAGPGRAPQPGNSMVPLKTYKTPPDTTVWFENANCGIKPPDTDPNFQNEIVYLYAFMGHRILGEKKYPGNGVPGLPGGKPGEGGAGGEAISNLLNLSTMVDNSGGDSGASYTDVLIPSKPGDPNPAYHVYIANPQMNIPDHWERNEGVPGLPATSPQADHPQGVHGQIRMAGDSLSWVQPRNIEAVLQYAEDLFLSRRVIEALRIFDEYAKIVSLAIEKLPSGDNSIALGRLLERLKHRQAQIALGMDYYGHPAGYVPLLSLEVTIGAYNAELDRAAEALYLDFWFTRKIEDARMRAAALNLLYKSARDKLAVTVNDLNGMLTQQTQELQDALDGIVRDQDLIAQKLKMRERELREIAEQQAEEAEHAQQSIAAMRLFAAALTLVPVLQPVGAIVAASIEGIANHSDIWTIVKDATLNYATSYACTENFAALMDGLKGLDFSSLEALQNSIDAKPFGSTDNRGTIISNAASSVYSKAKDFLNKKASDTIPADLASQMLARYLATDSEYQEYVRDAKGLLLKKQETFEKLQVLQHQIAAKAQDIGHQMNTIQISVKSLRDAELAVNTQVLTASADLRREAERRLRYYLYLIALAYEYRLLQPYRSALNINLDIKQMQEAANANQTELTPEQMRNLMVPYKKVMSQITEDIINAYDFQQKPMESQMKRFISLNDYELARLSDGENVEINLGERPEFEGLTKENLRLVKLRLKSLKLVGPKPKSLDVLMRHSGVSLIKSGHTTYGFRHLGYDGRPILNWRSYIYFETGDIEDSGVSVAAESLLLFLLGTPIDKFVLFSSPGLNAGLVLSLERSSILLQLSELVLSVEYTYQQI